MCMEPRILVWFSCGAASAVAAKYAIDKYGRNRVFIVYCDTSASEHPDNLRFLHDIENWLHQNVIRLTSLKYQNIDDVFEQTKYMAGPQGARCTTELKKKPRFAFQQADDIHVFGFTAEETHRIINFRINNPEITLDSILLHNGITKSDCLLLLEQAKIQLPIMYGLGFKNNNCIGCVKASSPGYWNKIRQHFPDTFRKRAAQSRAINCRLVRVNGERIFLDQLPIDINTPLEDIHCGPDCNTILTNTLTPKPNKPR